MNLRQPLRKHKVARTHTPERAHQSARAHRREREKERCKYTYRHTHTKAQHVTSHRHTHKRTARHFTLHCATMHRTSVEHDKATSYMSFDCIALHDSAAPLHRAALPLIQLRAGNEGHDIAHHPRLCLCLSFSLSLSIPLSF